MKKGLSFVIAKKRSIYASILCFHHLSSCGRLCFRKEGGKSIEGDPSRCKHTGAVVGFRVNRSATFVNLPDRSTDDGNSGRSVTTEQRDETRAPLPQGDVRKREALLHCEMQNREGGGFFIPNLFPGCEKVCRFMPKRERLSVAIAAGA